MINQLKNKFTRLMFFDVTKEMSKLHLLKSYLSIFIFKISNLK